MDDVEAKGEDELVPPPLPPPPPVVLRPARVAIAAAAAGEDGCARWLLTRLELEPANTDDWYTDGEVWAEKEPGERPGDGLALLGLRDRGRVKVGVGIVASSLEKEALETLVVLMGGGRAPGRMEALVLVKGEKLPGARL